MNDLALLGVLHDAADAVREALDGIDDWGLAGTRAGQYHSDLVADAAAVAVLTAAGLGVMSEESGDHSPGRSVVVVIDPVDGSTNASRGLPWYATSLCALDDDGPRVALVVNQASGTRFEGVRGGGAQCDGRPLQSSGCRTVGEAILALNGYPPRHLGWRQYRSLGAAALDLCAVAAGGVDGFVDCTPGSLGPWDYLGGLLICEEAGAVVLDAHGLALVVRGHRDRRAVLAAASPELAAELLVVRATFP